MLDPCNGSRAKAGVIIMITKCQEWQCATHESDTTPTICIIIINATCLKHTSFHYVWSLQDIANVSGMPVRCSLACTGVGLVI